MFSLIASIVASFYNGSFYKRDLVDSVFRFNNANDDNNKDYIKGKEVFFKRQIEMINNINSNRNDSLSGVDSLKRGIISNYFIRLNSK